MRRTSPAGGRNDEDRAPDPDDDNWVDEAIEESFPASDPPAFSGAAATPSTQPDVADDHDSP